MKTGFRDSKVTMNPQERQIIKTLNLFNKVLECVGDYEHDVKKLHYHDEKKIEYFDKIRGILYDYCAKEQ